MVSTPSWCLSDSLPLREDAVTRCRRREEAPPPQPLRSANIGCADPLRGANIGCADVTPHCDGEGSTRVVCCTYPRCQNCQNAKTPPLHRNGEESGSGG